MEIEKIKITDIKPAEYNPRKISNEEFNKLSNSLNEFGLVDPIIINLKNNKIIGGHQRYEVLLDTYMQNNDFFAELNLLKLGDIGWIFTETDLKVKSEDHEKALNLALNKISGEWDTTKLTEILNELEESELNLDLTGFDEIELKDIELYEEDYEKDEFDNLVEEYEIKEESSKNESWFYIEFYEETEKYDELVELLKPYLNTGLHEIDADFFYDLITGKLQPLNENDNDEI